MVLQEECDGEVLKHLLERDLLQEHVVTRQGGMALNGKRFKIDIKCFTLDVVRPQHRLHRETVAAHSWKCSRPGWRGFWATWSCEKPWQGAGKCWSLRSIPTQTFFWFYKALLGVQVIKMFLELFLNFTGKWQWNFVFRLSAACIYEYIAAERKDKLGLLLFSSFLFSR